MGAIRSFIDVWTFIFSVLSKPNLAVAVVSLVTLLGGAGYLYVDVVSGAWLAVAVGAAGLAKELLPVLLRYSGARRSSIEKDETISLRLQNIELPPDYIESGYELLSFPASPSKLIVRSREVNTLLRRGDLHAAENGMHLEQLNERLSANPKRHEIALLCQYRRSRRSDPPRHLFNEKKTCLASDLMVGESSIELFRGSYFHSLLTNEMATKVIVSVGGRPTPQFGGPDTFPGYERSGKKLILKSIASSQMGNHIGISTLVHTSDGQLVIWRQSGTSQHNRGRLVPTGSGSCDWDDWETCRKDSNSFMNLIAFSMKREFIEESTQLGDEISNDDLETKVLGFFRWINRGGKPEFVGISKFAKSSGLLQANVSEVDNPDHVQTVFPARTISQLQASINELLEQKNISIPLWVCLLSLNEAIHEDEAFIVEFLSLQK